MVKSQLDGCVNLEDALEAGSSALKRAQWWGALAAFRGAVLFIDKRRFSSVSEGWWGTVELRLQRTTDPNPVDPFHTAVY